MKKLKDFPEWLEAEEKLGLMQNELMILDAEKNQLLARVANCSHVDVLQLAAEKLLAGGQPETPPANSADLLDELWYRGKVLTRAIFIHRRLMGDLQTDLSKKICDSSRPQYRKLVETVAKAAAMLHTADCAEAAYRDELIADGIQIDPYLNPVILWGCRSRIEAFLENAKSAGY